MRDEFLIFPITANDNVTLQYRLATLAEAIKQADNLPQLAQQYLRHYQADSAYCLTIVGRDKATLDKQLRRAETGVAQAWASAGEWKSPLGSYFTAAPLGRTGQVAFIYPGAMNAYIGLGRELFRLFPRVRTQFAESISSDVSGTIRESLLHPPEFDRLSKTDLQALDEQLLADPVAMLEIGSSYSILYTMVLRDYFGVQPQAAFGYSLGESSMLWALGAWSQGDEAMARNRALSQLLIRPEWHSYVLAAPVHEVYQSVQRYTDVHLTIINNPNEVAIAGNPLRCQQVMAAIGCPAVRTPLDLVIHCPAIESAYEQFRQNYYLPTHPVADIRFYTAATYDRLNLTAPAVADNLATMLCRPLDFPRLLKRVYEDGARLFIEVGAGRTCTRWIGENLHGQAHVAIAINKKGTAEAVSIGRLLACLMSHRLPLNLKPLLAGGAARADGVELLTTHYQRVQKNVALHAENHVVFLAERQVGLQHIGWLMGQQMAEFTPLAVTENRPSEIALTEAQLREFAAGSIAACFGSAYHIYDDRRAPRIPNGELQLISRVLEIQTEQEARLIGEIDFRVVSRLFNPNGIGMYELFPYYIYMEMALQACGVLSVYLGAALPFPHEDFYVRNLDGEAHVLINLVGVGQRIRSEVRQITSTTRQGIIIEKYDYALYTEKGELAFEGVTTFGYFNHKALANQVGLAADSFYQAGEFAALQRLTEPLIQREGGRYGQGYVGLRLPIDPQAWFFACHFYQDPVMPGSLGVEAIMEAMQLFAESFQLTTAFKRPRVTYRVGQATKWQYRGQITPNNRWLMLDVHIKQLEITPRAVTLVADGSVWKDDATSTDGAMRIYAVHDVGIIIVETNDGEF